jgi:hypothetical protein
MRSLWQFIVALARELGDEAAYARHLRARGVPPSGAEWRKFSDEKMRGKYSRAKCC